MIASIGSGCAKEYSFENRLTDTLPVMVIEPANLLPQCQGCVFTPQPELGKWSFTNGTSLLCGEIDTAIVNSERTAFTFFGPSTCSIDTGAILTVYLPVKIDRDLQMISASSVAFYYYDNVKPSSIFISQSNNGFIFTVDSYSHQTKLASGRFSGVVLREDSSISRISNGKFAVELK